MFGQIITGKAVSIPVIKRDVAKPSQKYGPLVVQTFAWRIDAVFFQNRPVYECECEVTREC